MTSARHSCHRFAGIIALHAYDSHYVLNFLTHTPQHVYRHAHAHHGSATARTVLHHKAFQTTLSPTSRQVLHPMASQSDGANAAHPLAQMMASSANVGPSPTPLLPSPSANMVQSPSAPMMGATPPSWTHDASHAAQAPANPHIPIQALMMAQAHAPAHLPANDDQAPA